MSLADKTNVPPTSGTSEVIKFSRGGIVKSAYRRKVAADENNGSQENGQMAPEDWWFVKKEMVLDWIRCNPLLLGISRDSVNFVKKQFARGDENASLRARCWRHVVVEMASVPGLDAELQSVDEIPLDAEVSSLATVLGGLPNAGKLSIDLVAKMDLDGLKRLVLQENAAKIVLQSRVESLAQQIEHIKSTQSISTVVAVDDEEIAAPAGSGIAAVKALQRPASQPSGEDIEHKQNNENSKLPQRPLTDRSMPANHKLPLPAEEKNIAPATSGSVLSAVVEEAAPLAKVDLSKMTMLERNEHFAKIRQQKLEQKRLEKQEAEDAVRNLPRAKLEQRKLSASRWDHVRSRVGSSALTTEKKESKPAKNGSSLLDECRKIVGGKGGDASEKEDKHATAVPEKNKKATNIKKNKPARRPSRAAKSVAAKANGPSLLDLCTNMLKGTEAAAVHGLSASEVGTDQKVDVPVVVEANADGVATTQVAAPVIDTSTKTGVSAELKLSIDIAAVESAASSPPRENSSVDAPMAPQNNVIVSPSPPRERSFFDEKGSDEYKGKYNVQSPTKFTFDSFYRKRDKGTVQPGVSLLMARHEDTHKEEPIAIFFDRKKFTEDEASKWWDQNAFRFPLSKDKQ